MNSRDPAVGLCDGCRHSRHVRTPRSVFWMCGKSAEDPAFARYPRLPMLRCNGFEPRAAGEPQAEGPPPRR